MHAMRLDTKSLACTTLALVFLLLSIGVSVRLQNRARAADITTPEVGPVTETRFPPLVVPEGFQATLFACDPLIEYPSVIAVGPRTGTLFVAHDYLTGLGKEIVRRDEVQVITDTALNIFLMNGRLVSGVKIKEDKGVVTIGDNQGKVHEILRDEIEEMQVQPRSTMPDGLEKRLTDQEFLDLLAFLLSQKKK